LVADNGGPRNRTGALSVCLASPDGRVIGGGVGGLLIAASSVQVIARLLLRKDNIRKDNIENSRMTKRFMFLFSVFTFNYKTVICNVNYSLFSVCIGNRKLFFCVVTNSYI
jgi:hypothetical protein